VVICDRSVLDNFVYLLLAAGGRSELEPLVAAWTATYQLLVHVPVQDFPRADGIRSTDPSFQRAVEERLEKELAGRSLPVLRLDHLPREAWLDRVEAAVKERLRPVQLELT
jgi:hypothetical protein